MFKWVLSKWYKNSPDCFCGYRMKPTETYHDYSWKCLWIKKCGWETFQGTSGKLHWFKRGN